MTNKRTKAHIEEAIAHLKGGGLIVLADAEGREGEGDLIGFAHTATAESVNFMIQEAGGLICTPLSEKRAQDLQLGPMTATNSDEFGTAFTISVDACGTTTGISAADRAQTIRQLANPEATPVMFHRPGHIFPLVGRVGGAKVRQGHTELSLELAKFADAEVTYICEILQPDGTVARRTALMALAAKWQIPYVTVEEILAYLGEEQIFETNRPCPDPRKLQAAASVHLPTTFGEFQLSCYPDAAGRDQLLLTYGNWTEEYAPLVRIHSECLTGDVFGSHRCDCGEQLNQAMAQITAEGKGAILYLRQEGRGIGLLNKLKAYELQEQGLDTVEANHALGFGADIRSYADAASILQQEGVTRIRLLSNNPDKADQLTEQGIQVVEQVPVRVQARPENASYLAVKREKFHHSL